MAESNADIISAPLRSGNGTAGAWLRALEMTASLAQAPLRTFPDVVEELAGRFADAVALLSGDETVSYAGLSDRANRYARWALSQYLEPGDTVCLLMPNRPDYMAAWLGITRIGGVAALVNTRLVGQSLAHCIDIVKPKHVIVTSELVDAFTAARPHLAARPEIWTQGAPQFPDIDSRLARLSGAALAGPERRRVTIDDLALYVYTSGTTGLPKAAKISHYRLMMWTHWFAGMMATGPADRMYNCLPMYHSIGGAVATGAVLVNGGSVVIRERFSASRFWDDIVRFECTLFQYIGELCRFLVNAPAHPRERAHRLRLCCGNGLRADIWDTFKSRFWIPQVLEFYAATEANISLFNVEGRPGAIGRVPPFIAHRSTLALVKFDFERGAPRRNEEGLCMRCAPNETGEAIGRIGSGAAGADRGLRFDGYSDGEATEKKVLRNVFAPGDAWYRSGDLMRRDDGGYYYFVDRIGDTFRWKGENVACSEVEAALTGFAGVAGANVYGVAIPGADGRAGMAELVTDGPIDLVALREHLARRLPGYAHPVLLRMGEAVAVTATFKQMKSGGGPEVYDPRRFTDALYVLDPEHDRYVALDAPLYQRLLSREMRL